MPRLTHLCLGMCSVSLLVLGIITTPMSASAAPGDPQGGPSGSASYSGGPQNSGPQDYSRPYGGPQDNSQQYGGPQQYGSQDSSQQYGSPQQYGSQGGSQQYGGQGNSSCSSIHQIVAGENLTSIADANHVSLDELVEVNKIDDPNVIIIGESLCIPNGYSDSGYGDSDHEEEEYGPQQNSSYGNSPVKPGQSYDPSQYNNQGGSSNQQPGREQYGPQQNSSYDNSQYSDHNDSYGSQGSVSPIVFCPEDGRSAYQNGYQGTPGRSYDPSQGYPGYGKDGYHNNSYPGCDPIIHITATPVAPTIPEPTQPITPG